MSITVTMCFTQICSTHPSRPKEPAEEVAPDPKVVFHLNVSAAEVQPQVFALLVGAMILGYQLGNCIILIGLFGNVKI